MLTLRTKNFKLPFDLQADICKSFKNPLIFYLAHKNDARSFFITFVILDFAEKEMTYVVSYLPENISAVENHPWSNILKATSLVANPHCTLQEKKGGSFLTFIEYSPYFFKVDLKKNILQVYAGDDFVKDSGEFIQEFSSTNFKDDTDPRYFYFYSEHINKKTGRSRLVLHRASLDLSEIEDIAVPESIELPHTTKKIGDYILNSHFLHCQFKHLYSGKIFKNQHTYALFIYKMLYKEYCQKKGLPYADSFFHNATSFSEIEKISSSDSNFSSFCLSRGKTFLKICERNPKYTFALLPGIITIMDLKTKKVESFNSTAPAPAHFEIDPKTGDIFTSSHSFLGFERVYLWGPAAIDRFRLEKGKLIKLSSFSHPTGYRFTSHRIFSWKGKSYICTFGQPNRLFIIDAETMELEFFEDIETDFLSDQPNVNSYVNYTDLAFSTILTLEASPDGQFIFFLSYDYIYFYSFPERRIVQKLKYHEGTSPDGEISLADFYKRTTHSDYLS